MEVVKLTQYVMCKVCGGKGFILRERVAGRKSLVIKHCKYCGGNGYNYKRWETTCLSCGKTLVAAKGVKKQTALYCAECWPKIKDEVNTGKRRKYKIVYCKECGFLMKINPLNRQPPHFCRQCWQKIKGQTMEARR